MVVERCGEPREAERKNLARELHDGPVQDLIALGFSLAQWQHWLNRHAPDLDVEPLRRIKGEVVSVARRLRSLVTNLRPPNLEDYGLASSLQELAARAVRDYSASRVQVELDLEEIPELSYSERLCLFRAAQEALSNSLKHARARQVGIALKRFGGRVRLTVGDDGQGFEVPSDLAHLTRLEHYGLAGMAERVELLEGRLAVSSVLGVGTCVEVLLTPGRGPERQQVSRSSPI